MTLPVAIFSPIGLSLAGQVGLAPQEVLMVNLAASILSAQFLQSRISDGGATSVGPRLDEPENTDRQQHDP